MAQVRISRKTVFDAMQSEPVRKALKTRADKIQGRAEQLKSSEENLSSDARVWVEEGTRPKGRPFARVLCDDADQEHGTYSTPKIRLLGRAAGL